ncbi:hypothetical protein ACWF95_37375 [Streptomyces vinaceus]
MKNKVRVGLVATVATGAILTSLAPAFAVGNTGIAMTGVKAMPSLLKIAGKPPALKNPPRVKNAAYNQARSILALAGSKTAGASHVVHGTDDSPASYGVSILTEARDEFRAADSGLPDAQKNSGMSIAHYDAIHQAADAMGIVTW